MRISDGLTWTYSYDNENHLTGAGDDERRDAVAAGDVRLRRTGQPLGEGRLDSVVRNDDDADFGYDESGGSEGGAGTTLPLPWGKGAGEGSLYADLNGSNALQTRYLHGDAWTSSFADHRRNRRDSGLVSRRSGRLRAEPDG